MTETARALIAELETLPEAEQEEQAASYLEDLRKRKEEMEKGEMEPYASFTYLQEANLDLPPDYSETYERHLYGRGMKDDA